MKTAVEELCEHLCRDSNALTVVLVDGHGGEMATAGDASLLDAKSVHALFASSGRNIEDLVANQELAGEVHQTANGHVYVSLVGEHAILAVLFDHGSSLGLVRLRVRKASEQLTRILSDGPTGSGGPH